MYRSFSGTEGLEGAVPRPLSNIHEHGDGVAMQLAKLSQKWLGCAGRQGNWGVQFCSSCLCFHMELLAGQTVCHSGASGVVWKQRRGLKGTCIPLVVKVSRPVECCPHETVF